MIDTIRKLAVKYEWLTVIMISVVPVFFVYVPFLLGWEKLLFLNIENPGFFNIIRNWDGPNYIVVGKTMYDTAEIPKYLINNLSLEYYTAHLPLYPILMFLVAPLVGWLYSGVLVTLIFGVLLNILFYSIAKKYTKYPLFLTFIFTVFPGRYFIVRSIIAPETLLVFCTLLSIWLFDEKKYWRASLAGLFAVLTKIQCLFIFPAFAAVFLERWIQKKGKQWQLVPQWHWHYLSILLIPTGVLVLFGFYYVQTGDFFAFLNAQKDNQLFFTFPYAHFNAENPWALTGWLEDVVLYFFAMFVLVASLAFSKQRSWFYFALFYTVFLVLIPQRDITRFSMPLAPIFFLHFQEFFTSRTVRIALICILPAIYFYAINFMLNNQAPISDWTPFLAP